MKKIRKKTKAKKAPTIIVDYKRRWADLDSFIVEMTKATAAEAFVAIELKDEFAFISSLPAETLLWVRDGVKWTANRRPLYAAVHHLMSQGFLLADEFAEFQIFDGRGCQGGTFMVSGDEFHLGWTCGLIEAAAA